MVAGICVKTKNRDGKKVFVNLCKISEIPPPIKISEEELIKIIESEGENICSFISCSKHAENTSDSLKAVLKHVENMFDS